MEHCEKCQSELDVSQYTFFYTEWVYTGTNLLPRTRSSMDVPLCHSCVEKHRRKLLGAAIALLGVGTIIGAVLLYCKFDILLSSVKKLYAQLLSEHSFQLSLPSVLDIIFLGLVAMLIWLGIIILRGCSRETVGDKIAISLHEKKLREEHDRDFGPSPLGPHRISLDFMTRRDWHHLEEHKNKMRQKKMK